jgi:hypothetical protein
VGQVSEYRASGQLDVVEAHRRAGLHENLHKHDTTNDTTNDTERVRKA